MTKKYELTEEFIEIGGVKLFRIRALKSFGNVSPQDLGGYIQSEKNLSQNGDCWVSGDAKVYENAEVGGNAEIYGAARVYENARVWGDAAVCGTAKVSGDSGIYGMVIHKVKKKDGTINNLTHIELELHDKLQEKTIKPFTPKVDDILENYLRILNYYNAVILTKKEIISSQQCVIDKLEKELKNVN